MKESLITLAVISAYFCFGLSLLNVIHNAKPDSYIDEEFHVPQARKYCQGRFREVS